MACGRSLLAPLAALHVLAVQRLRHALSAAALVALVAFVTLVLGLVLVARSAWAHTLGLSSGEYKAQGDGLSARLSFAAADGLRLLPSLDADGDGRVSALEVSRASADLGRVLAEGVLVVGDGSPCRASLTDAALTEGDGLLFELSFACEAAPRELVVSLPLLGSLGEAHRHVARTIGETTTDALLSAKEPSVTFRGAFGPALTPAPALRDAPAPLLREPSAATRGYRFALSTREHLLVLVGLALVPWTRRARLGAILAFAGGHAAGFESGLGGQGIAGLCAGAAIALLGLAALPPGASGSASEGLFAPSRGRWVGGALLGFFTGLAFTTDSAALSVAHGAPVAFAAGVLLAQLSVAHPTAWLVRYARAEHALNARARRAMAVALALAGALSGVARALGR